MAELTVLSPERSSEVAARFAHAFVADPQCRWWWAALKDDVSSTSVAYTNGDPWAVVACWLPTSDSLVLLVTDEQAAPAGAVKGRLVHLAELVARCPYFEYVITDEGAGFGIFDTHHNALVRVG